MGLTYRRWENNKRAWFWKQWRKWRGRL